MKETKQAAASPEARAALHEVLAAFEGFKAANDQRLAALETKRADVLLEEKVARIDEAVSSAQARLDRALAERLAGRSIGGDGNRDGRCPDERKAAFDRYIKTGETPGPAARSQGSVGRRGHGRRLCRPGRAGAGRSCGACRPISPMRDICHGAHHRRRHVPASRSLPPAWPPAGWPRPPSRPETDRPPTLDVIEFPAGRALRQPGRHPGPARRRLCRHRRVAGRGGARTPSPAQETTAFVAGEQRSQQARRACWPMTAAADALRTWGKVGYLATGAAGAWPATNPTDKLIDLIYAAKTQYRPQRPLRDEPPHGQRRCASSRTPRATTSGTRPCSRASRPACWAIRLSEIEAMPDVGGQRRGHRVRRFRAAAT